MSSERVLDALMEASLDSGRKEAPVIEAYTRRLLELDSPPAYTYLHENAGRILDCLPKSAQRTRFVLEAWCAAPPEHWADWSGYLPKSYVGREQADAAIELVEHLVRRAGGLEFESTRAVVGYLGGLKPALRAIDQPDGIEAVVTAARETLEERTWGASIEASEAQGAMHELLRALGDAIPGAAQALMNARAADAVRVPLVGVQEVRGMLALTEDLPDETYDALMESLPKPDAAELPELYAEVALANATLHLRDPNRGGGGAVVRAHLKAMKKLREMGTSYWPQRRLIGVACLDLRPTPAQIEALSVYMGSDPGADAMDALRRWTMKANPRQLSDALARMVRPHFDATRWAAVLSEREYVEAPVIRALREAMGKDRQTKVEQRRRMASIVGALKIRTHLARSSVADLIIQLLKRERPKSDLSVALVLSDGLGSDHPHQTKLERAFIAYAKRNSHRFTPSEYRPIVMLGITIPARYLSKDAAKGRKKILEGAVKSGVKQLGSLVGL